MSFGQLPDFPVTPIVSRKTVRLGSERRADGHPYFSTPIYGIPYAARKDGTVFSGSSSLSVSHTKKSTESSQSQGQKVSLKISTNKKNEKETAVSAAWSVDSRALSKATVGTRSGNSTGNQVKDVNVVSKSDSNNKKTESKVENIVEARSTKRPANNENFGKVTKRPKLDAVPQSKSVLQPVLNVDRNVQVNAAQISDGTEHGEELSGMSLRSKILDLQKSSQSSDPGNVKVFSGSQRTSGESKMNSKSSVTSNLRDSKASSSKLLKSIKHPDSNTKATKENSVLTSSNVSANSKIAGSENAPKISSGRPSNGTKICFTESNKHPLKEKVNKKCNEKSKNRVIESNQRDSTLKQNDRVDSNCQITKQRISNSISRKRRIDNGKNQHSTSGNVENTHQHSQNKRLKAQPTTSVEKSTKRAQNSNGHEDDIPLLFELHVKPKVCGRWKSVTKPVVEFFSKSRLEAFMELFENVHEADVPGFVRCFDELEKRLNVEIGRIKVPTSKTSIDYSSIMDLEDCLQNDVDETAESVEHLMKLIEKTKLSIERLSEGQTHSVE